MSGYTPLFGSLTTGTLCGKWPDVGLWPIVLSLSDKSGLVDVTPMFLSKVTGLPETDVIACMRRFCEPDPYSRTGTERGARLVLIDSQRDWGWKIVNHSIYREKARKQMQQLDATASGRDADRKRLERERVVSGAARRSPATPAKSGADRPSDSDSDSDSDANKDRKTKTAARRLRGTSKPSTFHAEVIAAYHDICPTLPTVKVWTDKRRKALDARITERVADGKPADKIEYWRDFFQWVASSDWLCGSSGGWKANLAWLLMPENFAKTIEGNYNKNQSSNGARAHG